MRSDFVAVYFCILLSMVHVMRGFDPQLDVDDTKTNYFPLWKWFCFKKNAINVNQKWHTCDPCGFWTSFHFRTWSANANLARWFLWAEGAEAASGQGSDNGHWSKFNMGNPSVQKKGEDATIRVKMSKRDKLLDADFKFIGGFMWSLNPVRSPERVSFHGKVTWWVRNKQCIE